MPGDFWVGQKHFSVVVQTTFWLAVLNEDESKAWYGQGTCQVLPHIRSILFLSMFSKPSRMRVFTVDSLLSMGRKARVGRGSWGGFTISVVLFSFQHSSLFSALQGMQQLSHKTTGTAIPTVQISAGQIPKEPDLPWELPLPWAVVLDQINSSSNLKYSVILWTPARLNKRRPEHCTASTPMESHRGISEGWGISSFIWGTSWDCTESKVKAVLCFDHASVKTHCNQNEEEMKDMPNLCWFHV